MSSRPPLGVQQRQPQRSLSGPGLSQSHRPPIQQLRTLSQQHLPQFPQQQQQQQAIQLQQYQQLSQAQLPPPSSPVRDYGSSSQQSEGGEPASGAGRYGVQGQQQQQHRGRLPQGGSRLRLELSHDVNNMESFTKMDFSESPNYMDPSKPFTPSRIMTDTSDLAGMSPHGSTRTPMAERDPGPMPMPRRRARFAVAVPKATVSAPAPAPTAAATKSKDTRPKPYIVEAPPAAPRYSKHVRTGPNPKLGSQGAGVSFGSTSATSASSTTAPVGYADFYPWHGNHPEDKFSDSIIRHGYFDKPPTQHQQNETASAKSALFQVLKHKSGLNALSTVFTSVLGHRRHSRQITAPSTFKPPPRVTVTDTKKEIWLKDLANPTVPLRRLSRTIPHGIKGKVLLEQCLNKTVPVDRAIWLAKCVGANEIRSFKRKGVNGTFVMGGEAKWIREWTVCVEQFVETVFSAFGDPEWKAKVNYAIRLATHTYSEQLLDRDHYLDWVLDSFEKSHQSKVPMWMLIVQIYWRDMVLMRKTARKLVVALLFHLHEVQSSPDKDILAPLSSRLTALLATLMTVSPPSFVSPATWFKFRDTLRTSLRPDDIEHHSIFRLIDARNEQFVASYNKTPPAARQTLVRLLDMTLQTPMPDDLPDKCWEIAKDKETLVRIIFDWCTSVYRPGVAKVYVSCRVLRSWSTKGVDVTTSVLDYIDMDPLNQRDRKTAFYHLVCELTRSGHVSIPQYFQWLMARGGLHAPADINPDGPCSTRLLVELPIHTLSASQKTLRANMLRRASFDLEGEKEDHEMAIKFIKQTLGMPVDLSDPRLPRRPMAVNKLTKSIGLSSFALKADIGSWLQTSLVASMDQAASDGTSTLDMSQTSFNAIRAIFESAKDFSMLASILKPISRVSNCDILASCADTVSRHILTFTALNVAKDLFATFHGRLRVIAPEQGMGARPLLASLACLAARMPGMQATAAQLRKDLAQTDRNNPVDACSPVSDNMGVMDDAANLHEEIEKRLANGTVLDRATMNSFFQMAIKLLNSSWSQTFELQRAYSLLLARIRGFDAQHFDSLMLNWICHVRSTTNRPSISQMFPLLVCVGCLSLPLLLASTQVEQPGSSGSQNQNPRPAGPGSANPVHVIQITWRSRYIQEVLDLIMKPPKSTGLLTQDECYRIAILQDQALKENAGDIPALVRQALTEYSFCRGKGDVEGLPLDRPDSRASLIGMLRCLVLRDAGGVIKALSVRSPDPQLGTWIDCITTKLLVPDSDDKTKISFDQVFELTNEFTLPFCQLKLALSLSLADQNNTDTADRMQSHLELFAKAMDNAIDARNISWTGMLSSLSPEITHQLKSRAQTRFLDLLPSPRNITTSSSDRTLEQGLQMADNLLTVMDAIIRGGSMGRPPQLVPAMVEKLNDLWEILATPTTDAETKAAILQYWLPSMLAFITLHTTTVDSSKAGFEVRAKAVIVLAGILQEITTLPPTFSFATPPNNSRPPLSSTLPLPSASAPSSLSLPIITLSHRIFDLACHLADNLSDEVRQQCIRVVGPSISEARMRYIFSCPRGGSSMSGTGTEQHLMLSHKEKPVQQQPASSSSGMVTPGGARNPPIPAASAAGQQQPPFHAPTLLGTPLSLWSHATPAQERLSPFVIRRWEMLSEPTPNVGENDTALNLGLFEARRVA